MSNSVQTPSKEETSKVIWKILVYIVTALAGLFTGSAASAAIFGSTIFNC